VLKFGALGDAVNKINDKELVFTTTFLVRDDELVAVDVPLMDTTLKLTITFGQSPTKGEATANWHVSDGTLHMVFKGWESPLGAVTTEPHRLGEVHGRVFFFQLAAYRIGELTLAHFFILLGGANA